MKNDIQLNRSGLGEGETVSAFGQDQGAGFAGGSRVGRGKNNNIL